MKKKRTIKKKNKNGYDTVKIKTAFVEMVREQKIKTKVPISSFIENAIEEKLKLINDDATNVH